jgi:hypothetical protein
MTAAMPQAQVFEINGVVGEGSKSAWS